MSVLVWATKYELTIRIPGGDGEYKLDKGRERRSEGLVNRSFVEFRNSQKNNELYVIDEEKTAEIMEIRRQNLEKKAARKTMKNVDQNDILQSIASGMKNINEAVISSNSVSDKVQELRNECDALGINYRHNAGEKKLTSLINEHKNQ